MDIIYDILGKAFVGALYLGSLLFVLWLFSGFISNIKSFYLDGKNHEAKPSIIGGILNASIYIFGSLGTFYLIFSQTIPYHIRFPLLIGLFALVIVYIRYFEQRKKVKE